MSAPGRAVLVRLSALGDIVHALPVAGALRRSWPTTRLAWVVEQRFAPILRGHPAVDDVITVDTRAWRRPRGVAGVAAAVGAILDLRRRLRRARYDVAIDLQGLLKSGLVTWATGAPVRVGFSAACARERLSAVFANRRVTPPVEARHVVDQYLSLLAAVDVARPVPPTFDVPRTEGAETAIDQAIDAAGLAGRPLVVLNPGAGRPEKRWPTERFAALAREISPRGLGVVVLWGPGEESMAGTVARAGALLAPATDLHGLLAMLRRARIVVAGDTGPLHLAAALGVPTVGLFGPTSATRNGPYGEGHRTITARDGSMTAIDVGVVARAVLELVDAPRAGDVDAGTPAGAVAPGR